MQLCNYTRTKISGEYIPRFPRWVVNIHKPTTQTTRGHDFGSSILVANLWGTLKLPMEHERKKTIRFAARVLLRVDDSGDSPQNQGKTMKCVPNLGDSDEKHIDILRFVGFLRFSVDIVAMVFFAPRVSSNTPQLGWQ